MSPNILLTSVVQENQHSRFFCDSPGSNGHSRCEPHPVVLGVEVGWSLPALLQCKRLQQLLQSCLFKPVGKNAVRKGAQVCACVTVFEGKLLHVCGRWKRQNKSIWTSFSPPNRLPPLPTTSPMKSLRPAVCRRLCPHSARTSLRPASSGRPSPRQGRGPTIRSPDSRSTLKHMISMRCCFFTFVFKCPSCHD